MLSKIKYIMVFSLTALIGLSGCKKIFDLPEERDYLSPRADFLQKEFGDLNSFVLGRTTMTSTQNFNADFSTFPMKFEIVNPRFGNGRPDTSILQVRPTSVWTKPYTGLEQSLDEIEAKRKMENHPLFEVRSSGQFILWNSSNSNLIAPVDSDYIAPQGKRYFDVKISNTGGERIFRNFQLNVFRQRPYEPSRDIEPYKGLPTGTYNTAGVKNVIGVSTNASLTSNDVNVYMKKVGEGRSLKFIFWNKDSTIIKPSSFDQTKWDKLVHGFNMDSTDTYVKYDVAYPIPLARVPTIYTGGIFGSGTQADVQFSYARVIGKIQQISSVGYSFQIFEPGDWEMVFHFKRDNPKFEDE